MPSGNCRLEVTSPNAQRLAGVIVGWKEILYQRRRYHVLRDYKLLFDLLIRNLKITNCSVTICELVKVGIAEGILLSCPGRVIAQFTTPWLTKFQQMIVLRICGQYRRYRHLSV